MKQLLNMQAADLTELFCCIEKLLNQFPKKPILVGIDGQSASGKTTLGRLLQQTYRCNVFHMDDFFLQPHQRTKQRLAEPGGNVDYERFQSEVLLPVLNNIPFSYQVYDCGSQCITDLIPVIPEQLTIIEGAYSLHPYFGSVYDLSVLIKIEPSLQRARILNRNGPEMLKRFEQEWIPMENQYLTTFRLEETSQILLLISEEANQ